MKNAMQLKSIIKNIANQKAISAQIVLQNYMLERLLERVSQSHYRDNFILKGGFLIAAMVGLDTRATMDIDATIKGMPLTENKIKQFLEEIFTIEIGDEVKFVITNISDIRETDDYNGYRVGIKAHYENMVVPLKLDITTGDKITPREIEYSFKLLTEDRIISILAYNLESVLAEKLETIISRGDLNTRSRDYYDVYILTKLYSNNIDIHILKKAMGNTCVKRNTSNIICNYKEILEGVVSSDVMIKQWEKYQKDFDYAKGISFIDACTSIMELLDKAYN